MRISRSFSHLFVIIFSIFVFFVQGGEYALHLADRLPDEGDSVLNAWILAWNAHSLFSPDLSVWDAPIFYPVKNTLAFSENLLGNLWITLPIQWLTENHVLAANGLVFVSFILSSYFVFLMVNDLTNNYWASLLSGLIFSFNPYHWGQLPHTQLMPFFWAPLALLFANRFFKNRNYGDFWKMILFTGLQYYASIYLGTMLLTTLIIIFLVFFVLELKGKERIGFLRDPKFIKNLFCGVIAGAIALLPIGFPYLKVASEWDFFRTVGENVFYSAEPQSIFFPNSLFANYTWLRQAIFESFHGDKYETALFIGFVPLGLGFLAFYLRKREIFSSQNVVALRYACVTGILFFIMMGPYLYVLGKNTGIPMPFLLVHKLIPGGEAIRVPARFLICFLLSISILCGIGFCIIFNRLKNKPIATKLFLLFSFGAAFIFEYRITDFRGVALEPKTKFPPVYQYLENAPPYSPILELPFHSWAKFKYLHYQTGHWRPTIGGFSGWAPPSFEFVNDRVRYCPGESCAKLLQIVPFDSLIVHLDRVPFERGKKFESWVLEDYGFLKPKRFGSTLVWERDKNKEVPLSSKLHVDTVYIDSDEHGIIVVLSFAPEKDKGWRNVKRSKIKFKMKLNDSGTISVDKTLNTPNYILPTEKNVKFVKVFTRLGEAPDDLASLQISGELLKTIDLKRNDIYFLNEEKTSKTAENDIKIKWKSLSGINNKSQYKQGDLVRVRASLENTGSAIWLSGKLNSKLYDSDDGNMSLAFRYLDRKGANSCSPDGKVLKEVRIPIDRIIPPGETANFEANIPSPFEEGFYSLELNLQVKIKGQFKDAGKDSKKCIDFIVKNTGNPMSYGNLGRFFGSAKTPEDIASLEEFKRLSRSDQEEKILNLARFLLDNGGLNAALINDKNVHLWKKVLEIAEFLKDET